MEWPLKIMTDALGWVRKRGLREGWWRVQSHKSAPNWLLVSNSMPLMKEGILMGSSSVGRTRDTQLSH
jgi:hypothetical protein